MLIKLIKLASHINLVFAIMWIGLYLLFSVFCNYSANKNIRYQI